MSMCDCANRRDPLYTDMGDHWLVVVICNDCGKVLEQWTEPKRSDER